jgi:DNA-directed RNA polymerase sigma subunit (sigma70/sigma32)
MKTLNFTLEDLGLEMFHDQWKRVALWRMEESHKFDSMSVYEQSRLYGGREERIEARKLRLKDIRTKKAYDMRMQGNTWKVIGEALGVSRERARQIVCKFERDLKGMYL